jgi:hypothetical protein
MVPRSHAVLAGVGAVMLVTVSATAQPTRPDLQVWPSVAVTMPVSDRLEVRADGLLQVADGGSRVARELLRVVFVWRLKEHVTMGGGYTWTRLEDPSSNRAVEHRGVQQIELRIPVVGGASVVSSRTRLEERRGHGESAIACWLRQQARLDVALGARGMRAVVWGEYFHAINGTAWSGREGPRLVLSFVGLNVPLTRRTSIEPGYLNQTNVGAGRNQVRHAVAAFVVVRAFSREK